MILELELLDDVAVTALGASATTHETLTYLPGQCLLGAAAAGGGYGDHGLPDGAWRIFHSGAVRFGCALPLAPDGEPAWPVPFALHVRKGDSPVKDGRLDPDVVVNRAREHDAAVQYQQLREGYVDRFGRRLAPAVTRSMRTAIGGQGRARDGYLFTLSALARGARFVAEVAADGEALLAAVRPLLLGRVLRVGRSRHQEFGAVRATERPAMALAPEGTGFRPGQREVLFWCLADVCLRDAATGQPTLVPAAADVGLPARWRYAPRRSFVRTRRYSPFNGYRKRPDVERQVLVAGSVLRFETDGEPLSEREWDDVAARVARGVGEHRAEGLGRVVFEPKLLASVKPAFDALPLAPMTPAVVVAPPPDDALAGWVLAQNKARAQQDRAWAKAHGLLAELRGRTKWWLPASQWGEVRRLARVHREASAADLATALARLATPESGVRTQRSRWGAESGGKKLGPWLVDAVRALDLETPGPSLTLELVATHAVRQQRREQEERS